MKSDFSTIESTPDSRGGWTVTLNRPKVHNAFDEVMINELWGVLNKLEDDADLRFVIFRGNGRSFCAGADLEWMQRTTQYSQKENYADARRFASMLDKIFRLPCPTIVESHGSVFGGGVGLVACCDIAVASEDAVFSLSEVKLGLIPSVISPYVIQAIGARPARRYFLTAERFNGHIAKELGLVHEVCAKSELQPTCDKIVAALLEGGPSAQKHAKSHIQSVVASDVDNETLNATAKKIAQIRVSDEACEGMAAFYEKRPPRWKDSTGN